MPAHIADIIQKANRIADQNERVEFLRQNRNYVLDTLFRLNYDKNITFDLPEGEPPFTPSEYDSYSNIYQEIKRIERIFLTGTMPGLPATQRESLFIATLEFLDKDDAKILLLVKDKNLGRTYKNLKEALIKEAFPDLWS